MLQVIPASECCSIGDLKDVIGKLTRATYHKYSFLVLGVGSGT